MRDLARKIRKLATDCHSCRHGHCCNQCLCCMPEEKLREIVEAAQAEQPRGRRGR